MPGETKNDRLFDTWQDYGLIERNPHSGQAIWHVAVHGQAADGQEQGAYTHSLSMLKFPLAKVFADPEHYPEPMQGYIEVKESKDGASVQEEPDPAGAAATADDGVLNTEQGHAEVTTQTSTQKAESGSGKKREHAPVSKPSVKEPSFNKAAAVREPAFNKPKPAAVSGSGKHGAAERQPAEPVATRKANRVSAEDAADLLDAPVFEEAMVTARTAPAKPPAAAARPGQHEDI
ncbi:hypothetical protein D8I35_03745 [Corticibacter populi]|uniref:Uncharacterized protein n=1 Tax=Corticibacter populi TaxID=1550736 RepID=A0A3M6QZ94_9BURK|nr:hypothetical protein [Corticibacter populi]RMX08233.1 hypothetical protein D8I35_03745 [Corticibacter populi]